MKLCLEKKKRKQNKTKNKFILKYIINTLALELNNKQIICEGISQQKLNRDYYTLKPVLLIHNLVANNLSLTYDMRTLSFKWTCMCQLATLLAEIYDFH